MIAGNTGSLRLQTLGAEKGASDVAWAKVPMGGCRMDENIDMRES